MRMMLRRDLQRHADLARSLPYEGSAPRARDGFRMGVGSHASEACTSAGRAFPTMLIGVGVVALAAANGGYFTNSVSWLAVVAAWALAVVLGVRDISLGMSDRALVMLFG